ncbi:hypothetical protein lpari_02617 [Legionella parisiensis]|uniref:Cation-transporting P-type ATPase N-terminal domain-containing protein n=1 Tax=Legionella parisiensis TaxID=45071 RepID=A0A1E5JP22_9GAMM|nr:hypothetical protein lpari_02617 [Legionella parisiensis]
MVIMEGQWHDKSPVEIASRFNIDFSLGLSEKEAKLRLKEVGPNLLSKQKRTSPFIIFCSNLRVWSSGYF